MKQKSADDPQTLFFILFFAALQFLFYSDSKIVLEVIF